MPDMGELVEFETFPSLVEDEVEDAVEEGDVDVFLPLSDSEPPEEILVQQVIIDHSIRSSSNGHIPRGLRRLKSVSVSDERQERKSTSSGLMMDLYNHPRSLWWQQSKDTLGFVWERIPIKMIVTTIKSYLKLMWSFLTLDANRLLYVFVGFVGLMVILLNYQFHSNMQQMLKNNDNERMAGLLAKYQLDKRKENDSDVGDVSDDYELDYVDHHQREQEKTLKKRMSMGGKADFPKNLNLPQDETETPEEHAKRTKHLPMHALALWFMKTCEGLNLPVFLVEPKLLSLIEYDGPRLEKPPQLITFGLFAHNMAVLDKDEFMEHVEAEGSVVHLHMHGQLPLVNGTARKDEVVLHHILHDNHFIIHVVAFWSLKNFLYSGNLPIHRIKHGKFLSATIDTFTFGHQAKAFDVFPLKRRWTDGILYHTPADIDMFLWQLPSADFITCDYKRAGKFFKRHANNKPSLHKNAPLDNIFKGMILTRNLYSKTRRHSWLAAGSLLGWYRECGIMSHAQDADFGAWSHEYQPGDLEEFSTAKLPALRTKAGKPEDSLELTFYHKSARIDVFYFYTENDRTWLGSMGKEPEDKIRENFPLFKKLCSAELYGQRFNIPCNPDAMIRAEYGHTWESPKKGWTWYQSPENLEKAGTWPEEDIPDIIQRFT